MLKRHYVSPRLQSKTYQFWSFCQFIFAFFVTSPFRGFSQSRPVLLSLCTLLVSSYTCLRQLIGYSINRGNSRKSDHFWHVFLPFNIFYTCFVIDFRPYSYSLYQYHYFTSSLPRSCYINLSGMWRKTCNTIWFPDIIE